MLKYCKFYNLSESESVEFCATCLQRDADDWYSLCIDELGPTPFSTLAEMLDAM